MKHFIWISLLTLLGTPSAALADYWVQSRTQADGGAEVLVAWPTDEAIEFRLEEGIDEAMAAAVEAAFQTWQDVECAELAFTRGADVTEPDPFHWMYTEDRYIQVWWVDDPAYWGSVPSVGRADWVHDGNGVLIGAEIILNSKDHSWSTSGEEGMMDVQSVVTALIGKSLGIQSDSEDSVVFGSYRPGNTDKRTLSADDTDALQYVYGDGSCTPTDPAGVCPESSAEACGPEDPETHPADGGTSMPYDAGSSGGTDAGAIAGDGGVGTTGGGGDDGGCSVSAAGSSGAPGITWLAIGLLLLLGLGRRRE